MSEEDQHIDVGALPKFDMPLYTSDMTAKDVKSLALRHDIPLDLHLIALTKEWTMDKLPDDMIGLYEQYFEFSGIMVPFSTILLAVIKHFRIHISQLVPLGLNRLTMFELYCRSLGWKKRFFFLDRRAIPDVMAWRHHDSDVNDPSPKDGFSASDVQMLTEQHTARPLPSNQVIPEKMDHQKGVEGSRPATKRKRTAARKDGSAASEDTFSVEPIQIINPTGPTGVVAETAESQEDRSPYVSPRGSADHSVHNYSDIHHDNEKGEILRLGTFEDQSGRAMTHVDTEVVQPYPSPRTTYHSPVATQPASPLRPIQRGNAKAGDSSRGGSLYVPDWSIHQRCRLDTPMWCRELMVHLAPPAAQEESNALNNATALDRAWFSLVRGALAQTDIIERFDNLQTDFGELAKSHAECGDLAGKLVQARLDVKHIFDLYNSLSDWFKAFKSEHEGCAGKLEASENYNRELSKVNKGQALRIKELEDTLAKKDFALVYAERINVERTQEKENLVSQLGRAGMEKFDCIRKLLPTVVERLAEERSEEDLLELMGRMEGFDAYADKKIKVEYDKLFVKQYHYVEKISRGFLHSVSDLLKVYPDSPPHG
ncbi:hypothetical protein Tco_1187227 [Tanacetum coccineum]